MSLFAFSFYKDSARRSAPDAAFAEIMGHSLPSSITAMGYENELTDNFLHWSHYWLLKGTERDLRNFAVSEGFTESAEDARFAIPNLQRLFGVAAPPFLTGYEKDSGRNQWVILFRGVPAAIYVY